MGPTCQPTLDKLRLSKAGTPCNSQGIRLVYAGTVADWSYLAEEYTHDHLWRTKEICNKCEASKDCSDLSYVNPLPSAGWRVRLRDNEEYLRERVERRTLSPLSTIPGAHIDNEMDDLVHDDFLGLRLPLSGSVMCDLADEGEWGPYPPRGSWQQKLDAVMNVAYSDFVCFCQEQGLEQSQPRFKTLNLSMKTTFSKPSLKAKAKNPVVVSIWLLSNVQKYDSTEYFRMRTLTVWGFVNLWLLIGKISGPLDMDEGQKEEMGKTRMAMLSGYH